MSARYRVRLRFESDDDGTVDDMGLGQVAQGLGRLLGGE